jgi:hypothetical protein
MRSVTPEFDLCLPNPLRTATMGALPRATSYMDELNGEMETMRRRFSQKCAKDSVAMQ